DLPATPWKRINRALANGNGATTGDTVLVAPGTYVEAVSTAVGGITLRATGEAIVQPPSGSAFDIDVPDFLLDGFTIQGGVHGVRATGADGLTVRRCTITGQNANGVVVLDTTGATIELNVIEGVGQRGVLAQRSS